MKRFALIFSLIAVFRLASLRWPSPAIRQSTHRLPSSASASPVLQEEEEKEAEPTEAKSEESAEKKDAEAEKESESTEKKTETTEKKEAEAANRTDR